MGFQPSYIQIYSSSWGPKDDGMTVDGPDRLARAAFDNGVKRGRGGLGSIYVWAAGNGGKFSDNCNCDGYNNLIETITISSATAAETATSFSESCASIFAVAYSGGGGLNIATTDLHHICTTQFSGTSASAPLVTGIIALGLEANPNLSWRDVQHLLVRSARRNLLQSTDWRKNGVGRFVSNRFGYGLADAGRFLQLALEWKHVPQQRFCTTTITSSMEIHPNTPLNIEFPTDNSCMQHVDILEHVIVKLTLDFSRRGDLKITITSPSATESIILDHRPNDDSTEGFTKFEFLTVHFWDEPVLPDKKWMIKFEDVSALGHIGLVQNAELIIYGTSLSQHDGECLEPNVFDRNSGKCLLGCPVGTFRASRANQMDSCTKCTDKCNICKGSTKADCISWSTGSGKH